jgi:hypothetical protein
MSDVKHKAFRKTCIYVLNNFLNNKQPNANFKEQLEILVN